MILLGGYALLWWTAPPISRANFLRIEDGMTLAEVEGLLGGPPGDYSTGDLEPEAPTAEEAARFGSEAEARLSARALLRRYRGAADGSDGHEPGWVGDRALIVVRLDEAGRVAGRDFASVRPVAEPPLAKLRRWLGIAP